MLAACIDRRKRGATVTVVLALSVLLGCQGGESGEGTETSAKGETMSKIPGGKNRLALEQSPYLLQHADNPVDWYPWGQEAFDSAAAQDKPIFLSIGYSTCHWCHVMEHESFEDSTVAALMNDAFICIKVDREERPDIDNIYMAVCQMMTGRGGWPLTVLLTPSRQPFFSATYIPKPGMVQFIPRVVEAWRTNRERVLQDATRLTETLRGAVASSRGTAIGGRELRLAQTQLASKYDSTHGGFGTAPKFPAPHNLLFLLRHWKRTGDPQSLEMVEHTLERMRRGGMYDHVGFGFHRYSTDHRWMLPHFEKMLYDQALLVMAYVEAYQATGKREYETTAREIITYVVRDLGDAAGGFHSAEDADSEGEEGKFYVWTVDELRAVLPEGDAQLAIDVFGAAAAGNFTEEASGHGGPTGANILYLPKPVSECAAALGVPEDDLTGRLESIRSLLFEEREKRVHPGKDDKVLTDWNGLMIAALAKASRAFTEPEYAERAVTAADFLLGKMSAGGNGLYHRYRGGEASITGMVDDYAFLVWGLLELYETTFEVRYLEKAIGLTDLAVERFWDEDGGAMFFTSDDAEGLIVRQKEIYDGAVPSGNSVMMLNLIRLARITARTEYETRADDIGRAFQEQVSQAPSAFTQLMSAVDFAVGPSHEIVIVGREGADDVAAMAGALAGTYSPSKVVLFRAEGPGAGIVEIAPYTKEQGAIDGKATAYVCQNFACQLPTNEITKMLDLLGNQ